MPLTQPKGKDIGDKTITAADINLSAATAGGSVEAGDCFVIANGETVALISQAVLEAHLAATFPKKTATATISGLWNFSTAPTIGGNGIVTAAAPFGTANLLLKSADTGRGTVATGISVDASNNITTAGTIQATTGKFTNLTDGYIPYHISDASGLGNSLLYRGSSGQIILNSTNTYSSSGGFSMMNNYSQNGIFAGYSAGHFENTTNGVTNYILKSRGGAVGTHGAVLINDVLSFTAYEASDGAAYKRSAVERVVVDATVSSNIVPARFEWQTMNSAGTLAERMRLTSAGNLGISTNNPSEKLHVIGKGLFSETIQATTATFTNLTGTGTRLATLTSAGTVSALANGAEGYTIKIVSGAITWVSSTVSETYRGTWSAATNTPTLANGTGTAGDYYICSAAGTVNFGAGNITFAVGDRVSYNGSIWQYIAGVGYNLQAATASVLGGVKIGSGVNVAADGTISINVASANTANYIVSRDASGNFSAGTISCTGVTTSSTSTFNGSVILNNGFSSYQNTFYGTGASIVYDTNIPSIWGHPVDNSVYLKYDGTDFAFRNVQTDAVLFKIEKSTAISTFGGTVIAPSLKLTTGAIVGNVWRCTNADGSGTWQALGSAAYSNTADFRASNWTPVWADISDRPTTLPASDVYAWAKEVNKPTYTYTEVGAAAAVHTHAYDNYGSWTLQADGVNGSSITSGATVNLKAGTNVTLSKVGNEITVNASTGGGMVYPAAGIAVSTGTGWGTSIFDNSYSWNQAASAKHPSLTLGSPNTGLALDETTQVLRLLSGYAIPTTTKQGQWDSAYTNMGKVKVGTGSTYGVMNGFYFSQNVSDAIVLNTATTVESGNILPVTSDAVYQAIQGIGGSYTLPPASSVTRGGIKIGYSATGVNLPLQLSVEEKAFIQLTQSSMAAAITSTFATEQSIRAASFELGSTGWAIEVSSGVLYFKLNGVAKGSLDSSGNLKATEVYRGGA